MGVVVNMVQAIARKKFVVSSYTFWPDIGGVATNKSTLCDALVKEGYEVIVVTNTKGPDKDFGYKVYRNPNPLKLFWIYATANIVYLANTSFKLGWPMVFLNNTVRRKFGVCHHSDAALVGGKASWLKALVAKAVMTKCVHFPNSYFTQSVGRDVLADKISKVAYPIALKTKVELGSKADYAARKDIFFAGRLVEEKGANYIVEHWPALRDTLQVEHLLIAGEGPEMVVLKAMAEKPGMEGIRFLGRMPLPDVVEGMRHAAYVVIPSRWEEPFGNVGVEGVSSGAVVICSDRGGLPEAVGDVGVLFSFDEPARFGVALKEAKALRESLLSSSEAFKAYQVKADAHLSQFTGEAIVNIIREQLG